MFAVVAGVVRALFGADAAPAGDASTVADFLHHLLRRADAGAVLDLGIFHRRRLKFDLLTLATLAYVLIFPSTLAYLFFNRGLALIGPNRAAPFFHLVPVFGSAMAILLLGEQLRLFHLVGYALVLAGVIIASRQASARRREPCAARRLPAFAFDPGQASLPANPSKKPEETTI